MLLHLHLAMMIRIRSDCRLHHLHRRHHLRIRDQVRQWKLKLLRKRKTVNAETKQLSLGGGRGGSIRINSIEGLKS